MKESMNDELAALRAELERIRAALDRFVTYHSGHVLDPALSSIQHEARAALDAVDAYRNAHTSSEEQA